MDVCDRARLYMRTVEPAVSGQHGHTATFLAATALVVGFELSESEALEILRDEFNPRCQPQWSEKELERKVRSAAASGKPPPGESPGWLKGAAVDEERESYPRRESDCKPEEPAAMQPPPAPPPGRLPFDPEVLRRCFLPEASTAEWFVRRSPVPVDGMGPAEFLGRISAHEDRTIVFTKKRSQGQWMFWRGQVWRIGELPKDAKEGEPVRLDESGEPRLPAGAPEGVWWLVQPTNGLWLRNEDGKLSLRSGPNLLSCPYLVVEQDPPKTEDPAEMRALWLSFLAQAPLPIAAVYDSGGKSVHALLKVGCSTAAEFDECKQLLLPILTRHGADHAAIRPVQLSRLPGCYRADRLQRLLYLNPSPDPRGVPVIEQTRTK